VRSFLLEDPGSAYDGGPRDGEVRSIRSPMRIIQLGLKVFF